MPIKVFRVGEVKEPDGWDYKNVMVNGFIIFFGARAHTHRMFPTAYDQSVGCSVHVYMLIVSRPTFIEVLSLTEQWLTRLNTK